MFTTDHMFNTCNSIRGTLVSTLNQLKPACMSSSSSSDQKSVVSRNERIILHRHDKTLKDYQNIDISNAFI